MKYLPLLLFPVLLIGGLYVFHTSPRTACKDCHCKTGLCCCDKSVCRVDCKCPDCPCK
jgi:hypothetical protein